MRVTDVGAMIMLPRILEGSGDDGKVCGKGFEASFWQPYGSDVLLILEDFRQFRSEEGTKPVISNSTMTF